ncbi:hypothetical protein [Desertivirga brevis]|uniref:hypothetical protein n=1 Tax=Desertivirga brevis TaxID=2810310 RepID=UPI001A95D7A4|nr:hypothetical protein [Pedobacter sp. SYSU D00873]
MIVSISLAWKKGFTLFLPVLSLITIYTSTAFSQPINRFSLINRHNISIKAIDPLAPLSVGNGDFAFTADVTGFQTFENFYHKNGISLETMCTWAWHSFPNAKGYKLEDAMKEIDFHGRRIAYVNQEKSEAGAFFRQNPHPVPLGQISLLGKNNQRLEMESISNIDQKLDLWKGLLSSAYNVDGVPVMVETVSGADKSIVGFKIKSPLLKDGRLKPAIKFPYSYDLKTKNKPPFDWTGVERHRSSIISRNANKALIRREIDETVYFTLISWKGKADLIEDRDHEFHLEATEDNLEVTFEFSAAPIKNSTLFTAICTQSEKAWKDYWSKGGVIDFSGSTDPRATELERRIVLTQYLMKINYAGSFPPQETGLTHISWYGKHNSEVYWWHTAQFYEFNHTNLLEKSFNWYRKILPLAIAVAKKEGFEGARWPKMAGINGRPTPGEINPYIIWNQANPIYLAELIFRYKPNKATLNTYKDVVFESAKFLASYAWFDKKTDRYILGPPLKSVNESTDESETFNPSFELVQWHHGLKVAQQWRERMGLPKDRKWEEVLNKLSTLTIQEGKYVEMESDPEMYTRQGGYSSAMLMALGYLPKTEMVDTQIMSNTFDAIYQRNGLKSFVSWSLGKGAMTAARLGKQKEAVDILCNTLPGAVFLKNGHVQRAKEPLGCAAYLPANSAFLAAAGLMAAGWDGSGTTNAPGFPQDGTWKVRSENMNRLP